MADVVTVAVRNKNEAVECDTGSVPLKLHDRVVVQGEHGLAWGRVVRSPRPTPDDAPSSAHGRVVRRMTDEDERAVDHLKVLNAQAFLYARRRIAERGMAMRLLKVEYRFDAKQATFYYSAEQRVDFRDLVRELAYQFRIRVEMRQVSHRESPQILDGIGPCGRQLCCSGHIRKFDQVSVKMAKAQGLSLNPSKLAGCCGKLKCCLRYEYDGYVEFNKGLPRCGADVQCPAGVGKVVKHQYVQRLTLVRMEDGETVEIPVEELQRLAEKRAAGEVRPAKRPRAAAAPPSDVAPSPPPPPVSETAPAGTEEEPAASPGKRRRRRRRRPRGKGGTPSGEA
jgi:cell fate regulator YaaT (PSP1 superfamily)